MTTGGISSAELRAVVTDLRSASELRSYFGLRSDGRPSFTGSRFNFLGSEQPGSADRITAEDILAVRLLSVPIRSDVVLDLLEGPLGEEIGQLLAEVPTDVDLGSDAAAEVLASNSPAALAWNRLEQTSGLGWVSASKLLARKRPRVIPVDDRVVRCALGAPNGTWLWLNERFAEDGGDLVMDLLGRRVTAGLPGAIPAPRVLDVILWMRHHNSHVNSGVCSRAGLVS